ncbi:hypothetical protein AQ759_21885 [Burkholderia pseudomallei]|nr:hypothetical protein AQ759_21885 [Burkholderia pseudomallei]OMT59616.1 hypothetical protein AQ761_30010 [Burkholderia pseudomallei]ONC39808.1 hypothetical protein AQ915_02355 [Burkholderia pseudomallei]ONE55808.1 hypothetical protein AQ951_22105 [Burkholderia pseudomallei]
MLVGRIMPTPEAEADAPTRRRAEAQKRRSAEAQKRFAGLRYTGT